MSNDLRDELTMQEVTRENWRATLGLAVFPEQQRFIADSVPIAAIVLAKAYIRPEGLVWIPYAFYDNGETHHSRNCEKEKRIILGETLK